MKRRHRAANTNPILGILEPQEPVSTSELQELRGHRLEVARRCAAALYRAGASQVWLFGWLVEGNIGRRSDVDLAVEGIRPPALQRARRRIREHESVKVDVFALETAPPGFRIEIARTRLLLVR